MIPLIRDCLESLFSVADRSSVTRRCKFQKFHFYVDTLFSWYVYIKPLIKFDTTNIFKSENPKLVGLY